MSEQNASGLKVPLREHVALAVDGGGIKGVMVARALMALEERLGQTLPEIFHLTAGTSTGAIIAAAIAEGMDASRILDLYRSLAKRVFPPSWRCFGPLKYLVPYRYTRRGFDRALAEHLGDVTLGQLHERRPDFHMVVTASDLLASETRFIKLYKERYRDWRLRDAVTASSIVPTVFPPFQHRYRTEDEPADWIPEPRWWLDGGVGSYSNPCYMAAYEIAFCLGRRGWRLDNTTLLSIGTGINPPEKVWKNLLHSWRRKPTQLFGPEWIMPTIDTFLRDANLQQMRLVQHFFVDAVEKRETGTGLDFRRFNVDFDDPISLDSVGSLELLGGRYGEELGRKILADEQEEIGSYKCAPELGGFDGAPPS